MTTGVRSGWPGLLTGRSADMPGLKEEGPREKNNETGVIIGNGVKIGNGEKIVQQGLIGKGCVCARGGVLLRSGKPGCNGHS